MSNEEDSTVTAAKLKRLGIMPKGVTGCDICDAMGYIHCKCPPKNGDGSKSGKDDSRSNNENDWPQKESQNSAPYSRIPKPGEIPTLTLSLENSGTKKDISEEEKKALEKIFEEIKKEFEKFIQELKDQGVPVTKDYSISVSGNELRINIPNAKQHDDFISRLIGKKLLQLPEPQNLNQSKNTAPSPFSMKFTPFSTK
jgi:hypothetical protein